MRRLPGPAVRRLSEGDQTPEALYELFREWQRTQTQSSVQTLRSLRQQMDVRSCGMQGPPAERQLLRVRKTLIDKGAESCNDRREDSGRALHLRLRSARLRSDSGAGHRGSCACCQLRRTRRAAGALRARPKKSRAYLLTGTYMEVAYSSL